MFIAEYNHDKSYAHFEVPGTLPEEGILKGKEGEIRFKRIHDGLAVYDTTLLNTGFVYPGSDDDVYIPHTINNIPITEMHQTVLLRSKIPFTIEHGNLKRVYITVGKGTLDNQMKDGNNGLGILLLHMLREQKNLNQEDSSLEVSFSFCGSPSDQVELCSIKSDDLLVLYVPRAKKVEVTAKKTELRGNIPDCVEHITFSGKVYPFVERGWDLNEPNYQCFEGLKKLRTIDGSLSGNIGWSFRNCTSLEQLHLSNGIENIPAYAFCGCSSLKDIYIPDTVLNIGEYAFSNCTNLASIHLPLTLKKISKGMFNNCKSLKKVYLSDAIEVIEDYAFSGCINLRKPWIPQNIKYIADTAFSASQ